MTVAIRGFTPNKPNPSEKVKDFIEERLMLGRIKFRKDQDALFKYFGKTSPKFLLQTYYNFWNLLYTAKKINVTKYLGKVFLDDDKRGVTDGTTTKGLNVLSVMGLIEVVKSNDFRGNAKLPKYTMNLGPNAWAIENDKPTVSFSEEELKIRQSPWRTNSKRLSSKTREFKEEKDDELSSTLLSPISSGSNLAIANQTLSNHSLANLFAITERIHVDFKELERRLEQRKPVNPKQYYQDLRLIEHLKGEFSALMVSVLPENQDDTPVQNPGELDNVVKVLQLTTN